MSLQYIYIYIIYNNNIRNHIKAIELPAQGSNDDVMVWKGTSNRVPRLVCFTGLFLVWLRITLCLTGSDYGSCTSRSSFGSFFGYSPWKVTYQCLMSHTRFAKQLYIFYEIVLALEISGIISFHPRKCRGSWVYRYNSGSVIMLTTWPILTIQNIWIGRNYLWLGWHI